MKRFLAVMTATLMIGTSASASGLNIGPISLSFPPVETMTLGKGCLNQNATSQVCVPES